MSIVPLNKQVGWTIEAIVGVATVGMEFTTTEVGKETHPFKISFTVTE